MLYSKKVFAFILEKVQTSHTVYNNIIKKEQKTLMITECIVAIIEKRLKQI